MSKAGETLIVAAAMLMPLQSALAETDPPATSAGIPLYGSRTLSAPASEITDSALFGHPVLRT